MTNISRIYSINSNSLPQRLHILPSNLIGFNQPSCLYECAGEGNEACEKAILSCISLLPPVFKSIIPFHLPWYKSA